jgi:hypothetical protein
MRWVGGGRIAPCRFTPRLGRREQRVRWTVTRPNPTIGVALGRLRRLRRTMEWSVAAGGVYGSLRWHYVRYKAIILTVNATHADTPEDDMR